jgi:hypothetical protein
LASDADAPQVALAVAGLWTEIENALSPIIGRRGVAALYNRSLSLGGREQPWLADGHHNGLAAVDTSALQAALSLRAPMVAARAAAAHLTCFHDLLASLIGPSLTERLLESVWATAPNAPDTRDKST